MKKLLFLLLIPLVSFGQLKYKDLMKLDSKETYIQYMFDLQFSGIEGDDNNYALNPKKNDLGNNISTHFAYYFEDESTFYFEAMRMGTVTTIYGSYEELFRNDYDKVLKKVKRKCKFVFMRELYDNNFACYSCKDAEFEGYIGFSVIGRKGHIAQIKSIL